MTKMLSASGGLCPPDQGLCPWPPMPQRLSPPATHYHFNHCVATLASGEMTHAASLKLKAAEKQEAELSPRDRAMRPVS